MKGKQFFASLPFDKRLYREDIQGSIAHTKMLARGKIISEKEAELIIEGLLAIQQEIDRGKFPFRPELEDIHMNIEARLYERIGEVAGKLHTARSRNDQIALDMRLFCKKATTEAIEKISHLQRAFLDLGERNLEVVIPSYTHLQRAQPVLFTHHLLAYFEMLERDKGRFRDCLKRTDVLPLGSGAGTGVPYPVDREFLAKELGFAEISRNSLDAVSDRDSVLEFEAAACLVMMHLSRLAEEIVLWSSVEFGLVEVDEAYCSGSSIMPQKKNPDAAELVRGKTGRVYGHFLALLTTMKALPLSYNRDLQEDKEGLFDTVDSLFICLEVMTGIVSTLKVNPQKGKQAVEVGYLLATDLADYLVSKGVPFRRAHQIVKDLVSYALKQKKNFAQLSLEEYQSFSPLFGEDVYSITVESSLSARNIPGGTGPTQVREALHQARHLLTQG